MLSISRCGHYHPPDPRPRPTSETLKAIKVIWCEPFTAFLWGVPYDMRQGQAPRDICECFRGSWMFLGDGFGGCMRHYAPEEQQLVVEFLTKIGRDNLPHHMYEWVKVEVSDA